MSTLKVIKYEENKKPFAIAFFFFFFLALWLLLGYFNKIGFFYTCLNFDHVKNGLSDVFYKLIILGKSLKKPIQEKND